MRQTETEELERVKARVTNKAIQKQKQKPANLVCLRGEIHFAAKRTHLNKASYTHIRRYGQPNKDKERQRETGQETHREEGKRAGEGGGVLTPTDKPKREC